MVAGRTEEPICKAACDRGQMGLKERRGGHRRTRGKEGRKRQNRPGRKEGKRSKLVEKMVKEKEEKIRRKNKL